MILCALSHSGISVIALLTFNFDAKNNIFGFLAAREPQNGKIWEGSIKPPLSNGQISRTKCTKHILRGKNYVSMYVCVFSCLFF